MRVFFLPFFFLMFLPSALAFLISPPQIDIEFQPGLTATYQLRVTNNAKIATDLKVEVLDFRLPTEALKQELRNAVTVDTAVVSFTPADTERVVNINVKLPQLLSQAGTHELRIAVTEKAPEGGNLGAQASNAMRLLITVPQQYAAKSESPDQSAAAVQPVATPVPTPVANPPPTQTPPPAVAPTPLPAAALPEETADLSIVADAPAAKRNDALTITIILFLMLAGAAVYFFPLLTAEFSTPISLLCFFVPSVRRGQQSTMVLRMMNNARWSPRIIQIEIAVRTANRTPVHTIRPELFRIPPQAKHELELPFDTSSLAPGTYLFEMVLRTGRQQIPMMTYAQVFS